MELCRLCVHLVLLTLPAGVHGLPIRALGFSICFALDRRCELGTGGAAQLNCYYSYYDYCYYDYNYYYYYYYYYYDYYYYYFMELLER